MQYGPMTVEVSEVLNAGSFVVRVNLKFLGIGPHTPRFHLFGVSQELQLMDTHKGTSQCSMQFVCNYA